MRLGQVVQLLDARAEADAEPLATAEGDERVRQLVAAAERVGPRIHVAEDPLHAIRRSEYEKRESGAEHGEQREEMPAVHAAEKKHREGARGNDHQGAEVRLAQQQPRDEQHHDQHRQQTVLEAFQHAMPAHGVVGGIKHAGKLHQLRRLDAEHRQREPATGAVHFAANARDEDRDEKRDAGDKEQRRQALPYLHRHEKHRERGDERGAQENGVPGEKPGRAVAGVAIRLGGGDRGGIDHDEPGRREHQRRPGERAIVLGRRGIARQNEGRAHGSARTAAANTSPRCL